MLILGSPMRPSRCAIRRVSGDLVLGEGGRNLGMLTTWEQTSVHSTNEHNAM